MKNSAREIIGQICTPSLKIVTYLLAVSLASTAGATDFVWTGNTQYAEDWFDNDNWTVGGVVPEEGVYPGVNDTAIFEKDATLNVGTDIAVGKLVVNNSTLTHRRSVWLTVGEIGGTNGKIKLMNQGRLRNAYQVSVDCPLDIEVTGADGKSCSEHSKIPYIQGNGADFKLSGRLLGDSDLFVTMYGYFGVDFAGDNSAFTGTVHVDGNQYNRAKFSSASAGFPHGKLLIHGSVNDIVHFTYIDENHAPAEDHPNGGDCIGTIKFGSIETEQHGRNYAIRFTRGGTWAYGEMEVGGLNKDDRLSLRMRDNGDVWDSGLVKIKKVGTGTLEIWHTGHCIGTEIADGVVLANSADALNGKADGYTSTQWGESTIMFTGGTLKYGRDEWTDTANPVDITTDWSGIVKNSTDFIAVDTDGKDVDWATDTLKTDNPDAKGIKKLGEGTLTFTKAWRNGGTRPFFTNGQSVTNYVVGGTLAIGNANKNNTPDFNAKMLGTGTVRIITSEDAGGYRLRPNGSFEEFEGTLEWASENNVDGKAVGFMPRGNGNLNWPNLRFRITGNPESETMVIRGEAENNKNTVTVGAYDHLYPTAVVRMNAKWYLNINGTKGDSYLNGKYIDNAVAITKTGPGKLTMGPGFSAPEGSTIKVKEGVFAMDAGMTAENLTSYLTIDSGVKLTGSGVFGAVDLAVNDVVVPDASTFTNKTAKYEFLTATSFSNSSSNISSLLATLNANETHGKWVETTVDNGDGTWTLKCDYRKAGLTIILR